MAKCGNCGKDGATVAEIRTCYQSDGGAGQRSRVFYSEQAFASDTAPEPLPEITEGMWKLGDTIYKVQRAVNGSGRLYGKALRTGIASVTDESPAVWFDYVPNVPRILQAGRAHKLTLEEAKEFGALYGTCCVCGRTLTNETSIEAGIGPICAGRLDA